MSKNKQFDFNKILSYFQFDGEFVHAHPYGFGHINDTFAAYFKRSDGKRYRCILQRINTTIFNEPEKLMENIKNVTLHLRKKIIELGGDPERGTLNLIQTKDKNIFCIDEDKNYWRAYVFIEEAKTYQMVKNAKHFFSAGRAFGNFQKLLNDFPAETLHETIPDFHNTNKRLAAFAKALEADKFNRAVHIKQEINFVTAHEKKATTLTRLQSQKYLPLRVTHNDTKFNNVMIDDKTGEGICVIDLDTVMPGLSLYDFGDAIRSGANASVEDEIDLSKVYLDTELYNQFSAGFLEIAGQSLTSYEKSNMSLSAIIMTLECGIRFLTDYLNGDVYFKVHRKAHNLDRTRVQFKLVQDMENKFDWMQKIIDSHI